MVITFFKNIYDNTAFHSTTERAFERIRTGASRVAVEGIRSTIDKDLANAKKAQLPSVLFSGKFSGRNDKDILEHNNFLVLDFDGVYSPSEKKEQLKKYSFIKACWVSPSGNGVKALVKIKSGTNHKEHFVALKEIFPDLDPSGANVARVCYESFDPEIWVNENPVAFDKLKKEKQIVVNNVKSTNEDFNKILVWLSNKGDAFRTGERNLFLFKLASACCRFGISETECLSFCTGSFLVKDESFSQKEAERTIKSAFKKNTFGTAVFEKDNLVDFAGKTEIVIDADVYNLEVKPKDVIYGLDVKADALKIYRHGYESADKTGADKLDEYFKFKKGEITLISGIGNYGKSNFLKWLMVLSVMKFKRKFAIFTPEEMPAHEFYYDLTEVYLGSNCTPSYQARPSEKYFLEAYDIISNHIFCIYPETILPTPDYVKEKFLELIIKENVYCCIIDPFNQLSNDYQRHGGNTAKYLETFLSECSRFAITNSVPFLVVAHPHKLVKQSDGNYPCPDVFEIADGAMWNNKMDNIIIYHRPNHQNDPESPACELHTKKIRRQKIVGKKGMISFELNRGLRRYLFDGIDYFNEVKKETAIPANTNFYESKREQSSIINADEDPPF